MLYQDMLREQAELVEKSTATKKRIQLYELENGYNDGRLLSVYIGRYANDMGKTAAGSTVTTTCAPHQALNFNTPMEIRHAA